MPSGSWGSEAVISWPTTGAIGSTTKPVGSSFTFCTGAVAGEVMVSAVPLPSVKVATTRSGRPASTSPGVKAVPVPLTEVVHVPWLSAHCQA